MGVGLRRGAARGAALVALTTLLALLAVACGAEGDRGERAPERPGASSKPKGEEERRDPAEPGAPTVEVPDPPACIDDGAACVQAGGRILYVERVDPDGDGDAHFVTTSTDSITAPGITVFDVRPDLRPDPLPGPGDVISASGPVLSGSYGQRQIEADAVAVDYAP